MARDQRSVSEDEYADAREAISQAFEAVREDLSLDEEPVPDGGE